MSSVLRPKKKKVLSAKRVWKGITDTPRACLDKVVRYIRSRPSFLSGRRRSQEKRSGIIFMQEEEQRENPSSRIIVAREQQKMEGSINVKPAPEAASSSSSSVSGTRVDEDQSIFDDDSIKRNNYKYGERFQLEKEISSSLHAGGSSSDHVHVDDSIFEDFIQRNRERFRLEKQNSLERLNYYALWPYYAYFDPDY